MDRTNKSFSRLLVLLLVLLATVCIFVACDNSQEIPADGNQGENDKTAVVLSAPNPTVDENGTVTWNSVPYAVGYVCQSSEGKEYYYGPEERSFELATGGTLRVKAIGDGENYLDSPFASISYYVATETDKTSAKKLDAPVLSVDENGLVTWGPVENATGYKYRIDAGKNETVLSADTTSLQLRKSLTLFLKATGDEVEYFDSDYAVLVYTQGEGGEEEVDDGRESAKVITQALIEFLYDVDEEQRSALLNVIVGNGTVDDFVTVFGADGLVCDAIDMLSKEVGGATMIDFIVKTVNALTENQYETELAAVVDLYDKVISKVITDADVANLLKAFCAPVDEEFVTDVADFGKKVNGGEELAENFTFIFVDYLLEVAGDKYTPSALKTSLSTKLKNLDYQTKLDIVKYFIDIVGEDVIMEAIKGSTSGTLPGGNWGSFDDLISSLSSNPILMKYLEPMIDSAIESAVDYIIDQIYTDVYAKLVEISKLDRIPVTSGDGEGEYDYTATDEYKALDKALKELATLLGLGETAVDEATGEEQFTPADLMAVFKALGNLVADYVKE